MAFRQLDHPVVPHKPLTEYKLMSFDIYGTLVDWESGVYEHILPLQQYLPSTHPLKTDKVELYRKWDGVEVEFKRDNPKLQYDQLLLQSFEVFARRELGIDSTLLSDEELHSRGEVFGQSVKDWPAFPDTVSALYQLRELGYKLVPLSNINNASFALCNKNALQSFPFDAVYTGEDIGSYKPEHRNFFYLFDKVKESFGVDRSNILHVAHGLYADHVPAKELGLQSVWIERLGSACETPQLAEAGLKKGDWTFGWSAGTLQDLADAVKEAGQS